VVKLHSFVAAGYS